MTTLLFLLGLFLPATDAADLPYDSGCETVFQVTSCGGKPIKGASIKLYTGHRKYFRGSTDKSGQITFDQCLLNFRIYGEPKFYLASGDSAYVYKVFPEGQIIRITEKKRLEKMHNYLRFSVFSGSNLLTISDSILLYRIDAPTSIVRMNMKYKTNRLSRIGVSKARSKMKIGNKAIKGFVTGQCRWREGKLVCPINICS